MAKTFRYFIILLNLQQIYHHSFAETEDLQKKFTSKCDDLCINPIENATNKVCVCVVQCYQIVDNSSLIFPPTSIVYIQNAICL